MKPLRTSCIILGKKVGQCFGECVHKFFVIILLVRFIGCFLLYMDANNGKEELALFYSSNAISKQFDEDIGKKLVGKTIHKSSLRVRCNMGMMTITKDNT